MSGPTPVRTLRVPDEIWRAALARASADGTSVSVEIVAFLRAYGAGERFTLKALPRDAERAHTSTSTKGETS